MTFAYLSRDLLVPGRFQPRGEARASEAAKGETPRHDAEADKALRADIQRRGVRVPLIVTPGAITRTGERGFYVLAGHRRLFLSDGIQYELPCLIDEDATEEDAEDAAILDNALRTQPNEVDEGFYIAKILNRRGISISELADQWGHSEGWANSRLAQIRHAEDVQQLVRDVPKMASAAPFINRVTDAELRADLIQQARDGLASGRAIESAVREWEDRKKREQSSQNAARRAPDAQTHARQQQDASGQSASVSRGRIVQSAAATHRGQQEIKTQAMQSLQEAQRFLMNAEANLRALPDPVARQLAPLAKNTAIYMEKCVRLTAE